MGRGFGSGGSGIGSGPGIGGCGSGCGAGGRGSAAECICQCAYPQGPNANGAPEGAPFTEEEGYRARWKSGGHPFGATSQYFPALIQFQTNTNSISS